jgi:hypothetical protein
MSYYLREYSVQGQLATEIWKIENGTAVRLGITNAPEFTAEPGETIWDTFRRLTPWFEPEGTCPFHKTVLDPGQFYPRMARPSNAHPTEAPGWNPGAMAEQDFMAISRGQLTALMRQLDRICQTVQPTEKTFDTFGHDIRNLLILACTEVESHWRGVLVANGLTKVRFNTFDYVMLRDAMRLDEYAVDFPIYPWLQPLKPFAGWSSSSPTRDLKWYDAYNAVKHDRETEFERGTLRHAFEAVASCAIMMVAQFGLPVGLGQRTDLSAFFNLNTVPSWPLSEVYVHSYGESAVRWSPVRYEFKGAGS